MANTAQQLNDLDNLLDGMEGIDELNALDFETEEVEEAVVDENEALEAAQQEIEAELDEEETADDELEALLADGAESDEAAVEEEPDLDEIEASVKAEERQKRLEEASMSEEEAEEIKAKSIATEAKEKVEEVKAKPKTPPKDAINVSEVIESKIGINDDHWKLIGEYDGEYLRETIMTRCEELPKKTREKVVNLMDWWTRGHSLSVYTRIGFEQLIEEGELTGVALRNRYMSNPGKSYTLGTSNAQSGQIVKLFKAFFITNEDGTINAEHAMVKRYKEVYDL